MVGQECNAFQRGSVAHTKDGEYVGFCWLWQNCVLALYKGIIFNILNNIIDLFANLTRPRLRMSFLYYGNFKGLVVDGLSLDG